MGGRGGPLVPLRRSSPSYPDAQRPLGAPPIQADVPVVVNAVHARTSAVSGDRRQYASFSKTVSSVLFHGQFKEAGPQRTQEVAEALGASYSVQLPVQPPPK